MLRHTAFAVGLIFAPATGAIAATPDVGKTVEVKNQVTLESGGGRQALTRGEIVHQDEIILTAAASRAEIELLDRTKLAVGPDARLVLDKFVYNPSASSITVTMSQGAFRFITGAAPKESYQIKTPTASLGVRGSNFDVSVVENRTFVLLNRGGVNICNLSGDCKLLDRPRQFAFVDLDGSISFHSRWDPSLLPGASAATVFPFVGVALLIDPVVHMTLNQLTNGPGGNQQPNPGQQQGQQPNQQAQQQGRTANTQQAQVQTEGLTQTDLFGITIVGGLAIGLPQIIKSPQSP